MGRKISEAKPFVRESIIALIRKQTIARRREEEKRNHFCARKWQTGGGDIRCEKKGVMWIAYWVINLRIGEGNQEWNDQFHCIASHSIRFDSIPFDSIKRTTIKQIVDMKILSELINYKECQPALHCIANLTWMTNAREETRRQGIYEYSLL